jgi:hypothetical protein
MECTMDDYAVSKCCAPCQRRCALSVASRACSYCRTLSRREILRCSESEDHQRKRDISARDLNSVLLGEQIGGFAI